MATRGELDYRINTRLNSRGIDQFNRKLDEAQGKIERLRGGVAAGGGGQRSSSGSTGLEQTVRGLALQSRIFTRVNRNLQRQEDERRQRELQGIRAIGEARGKESQRRVRAEREIANFAERQFNQSLRNTKTLETARRKAEAVRRKEEDARRQRELATARAVVDARGDATQRQLRAERELAGFVERQFNEALRGTQEIEAARARAEAARKKAEDTRRRSEDARRQRDLGVIRAVAEAEGRASQQKVRSERELADFAERQFAQAVARSESLDATRRKTEDARRQRELGTVRAVANARSAETQRQFRAERDLANFAERQFNQALTRSEATNRRREREQARARRVEEARLRRLQSRGGNLLGVGFSLQRVLAAFAVFETGRQLANVTRSLVTEAIQYNRQLEVSQASLTGLIAQAIQFRDQYGEIVPVGEALGVSSELAREQIEQLRLESRRTTASLAELVQTFQTNTNLGLQAGLDLSEVRQFTVLISQAATALGLPQNQLAEEVRSLLQGTINPRNSRIAVALGITNDQIRNARSQGQLFRFLRTELEAFGEIAEAQANTLNGRLLRLRQILQELAGEAGGGFSENLRQNLGGLLDLLLNDDQTLNQNFIAALQPFFDSLDNIQDEVFAFFTEDNLDNLERASSELGNALEFAFSALRGVVELFVSLSTFGSNALDAIGISAEGLGRALGTVVPQLLIIRAILNGLSGIGAKLALGGGAAAGVAAAGGVGVGATVGRGLLRFIPVVGQLILALEGLRLVVSLLGDRLEGISERRAEQRQSALEAFEQNARGLSDQDLGVLALRTLQEIQQGSPVLEDDVKTVNTQLERQLEIIQQIQKERAAANEPGNIVRDLSQGGLDSLAQAFQPGPGNELRFQQAIDNFLETGDTLARVLPTASQELDAFFQQLQFLEDQAVAPFDEFNESFEEFFNRVTLAPEAIERLRNGYESFLAALNSEAADRTAEGIIQSFNSEQQALSDLEGTLKQLQIVNDAGLDSADQQLATYRAQRLEIQRQFDIKTRDLLQERQRLQILIASSNLDSATSAILQARIAQINVALGLESQITTELQRQLELQNAYENLKARSSELGPLDAFEAGVGASTIDPTTTGDAFFAFGEGLQDNTASALSAGIQQGFLSGSIKQGLEAFALSLGQSVLQALSDAIAQALVSSFFASLFTAPLTTATAFPSFIGPAPGVGGARGGWLGFDGGGKVPMSAPRAPRVPGLDRRDTVAARLRPGEFVVRPEAALSNLGFLSRLNATGSVPRALASRIQPRGLAGGGLAAFDISQVRPGIPSSLPGQSAPSGSSTTPTPRMPGARDTLRETVILTEEALERSRGGRALEDQLEFYNGRNRRS